MNITVTPTHDEQPQTPVDLTSLQRLPGETTSAYNAFMAFFQLGRRRSLQAVADQCGTSIDTIKKWSSRFDWKNRIQYFTTGVLQQQVEIEVEVQRKRVAEWSARMETVRELQWIASQDLLALATKFLDNFGDEQLEKMTMNHVCRAVVLASKLGHMALADVPQPPQFPLPQNQTRSAYIPPRRLPVHRQVTRNPKTPRLVPTTPEPTIAVPEAREKNISAMESAEKCYPLPNGEPIATNPVVSWAVDSPPSTLSEPVPSITDNRKKNISASESAKKYRPLEILNLCETRVSRLSTIDRQLPQSHSTVTEDREKNFSSSQSAEKCHSLPTADSPFIYNVWPSTFDHRRSTSFYSSPLREVRRTQKIFPVTKSAAKCRSLPGQQTFIYRTNQNCFRQQQERVCTRDRASGGECNFERWKSLCPIT